MGKNGGGKKKGILVPPPSTRGATGGVPMVDSSRGWNPFVKTCAPMVNQVEQSLPECLVNRSVSTIPSVSPSSTLDRSGFSSLESDVNWSDVVKGLKSGSQSDGVHDFPASQMVSLPMGEAGLFPAGYSSCLVTPVQSPVLLSGSVSSHAAGKSLVEAVTHDVLTPDIRVMAGCLGINPSVEPVSHGSDGVASSPLLDIPVVAGSPVIFSPENTLSQDITSPMSAGEDVTAGYMRENPNVYAPSTGPPDTTGLHQDGLASAGPYPIGSDLHGTGKSGLTLAGPNLISSVSPGPVFNVADGSVFSAGPGLNSPFVGLKNSVSGPNLTVGSLQFGSFDNLGSNLKFACDKNISFNDNCLMDDPVRVVVPKEVVIPKGPSMVVSKPPGMMMVLCLFKIKKWRVKKPNTGGLNSMSSVAVDPVVIGPATVGPKDAGLVDVPHMVGPPVVSKGTIRDKGKIPVSNQFDSLGGPVLDDFDDFFDGVTGLWESERQTAHYYIEYGFKPPDFVFEKWSPKLKIYYSQLTKVDSINPGGPSTVIEVVEDDEVASVADESSRFMKMS
ncbi:hypothetical protein L1987_10625 [Smallanthus sonchifolius]|uniref:Uncharacterized protein n=1 Tax=Smallanthus sonchifolius TaxID=185202 RepID=A0ACB9JSS7_9ASTR|nr:hypothetical protein L1987_10625 [Smallanthus sonchifolius]